MDKIVEDLEDAVSRYNSKILYCHVNKLRGRSQSRLVSAKDRNATTINDKESVKKRWAKYFENVLNRNRVAEKHIEENEKNCDTLIVKED